MTAEMASSLKKRKRKPLATLSVQKCRRGMNESSLVRSLVHVTVPESHRRKEVPPISERHMPTVPTREENEEREKEEEKHPEASTGLGSQVCLQTVASKASRRQSSQWLTGWGEVGGGGAFGHQVTLLLNRYVAEPPATFITIPLECFLATAEKFLVQNQILLIYQHVFSLIFHRTSGGEDVTAFRIPAHLHAVSSLGGSAAYIQLLINSEPQFPDCLLQ